MTDEQATVDALQAALAGEHSAVYAYGQAAGPLRGAELDQARRFLDAHRARRDRLRALLVDRDAVPVAAAAMYEVPASPTATDARVVLGDVELRLAAPYADLAAPSTGDVRELAIIAIQESTVRATRWGATVPAFPGLPERSQP